MRRKLSLILACAALACLIFPRLAVQAANSIILQFQSGGVDIAGAIRPAGLVKINCTTATFSNSTYNCTTAGATGATGPPGTPAVIGGSYYFPNYANKGSLVGTTSGASIATANYIPGYYTTSVTSCLTSWLRAGTFRNLQIFTSTTNGTNPVAFGVNPGCLNTVLSSGSTSIAPSLTGVVVPPSAAAGTFSYPGAWSTTEFWHQPAVLPFVFAGRITGGAGPPTLISALAEFVDDAGLYYTMISNGSSVFTASANNFLGFNGQATNATELNTAFPIPVAGTIDGTVLCSSVSPTNTVVNTLRKNGASQTVTFNTLTSGCNYDNAHTVSVAAGDYIDILSVTGATTQAIPIFSQVSFYPSSGTSQIVGGTFSASTVSTTKTYYAPLTNRSSTTEASAESVLPVALACTNLYVTKATANSGVTTTYTIRANEADTAITGTDTGGTGSVLIYSGTAVNLSAGQRISLSAVTASGTSGTQAAWSMSCQ